MAKKTSKKARKSEGVAAAAAEEGVVTGSVRIPVQASIWVGEVAHFNELVIEWSCLGLSEEPDSIEDTSGNARLLDPKRPPYTDADGLHLFFDPPIAGATNYGFRFDFIYNESVIARTAEPKTDQELAKEREDRETARADD